VRLRGIQHLQKRGCVRLGAIFAAPGFFASILFLRGAQESFAVCLICRGKARAAKKPLC
jgi:hypothetical protein